MRLILDNVSKRDYEWLQSMAKALNFKVTAESSAPTIALDHVDSLLDNNATDTPTADFMKTYGVTEADVAEFRQRKADYLSGDDNPVAWKAVKER
ncbi:hypothetical protein [Parapedobacter sp. 10938]|uniref:hypothetical protein n=1 Tax=Parapedobacter flavus TaxID=3110225 RepID=UPI002DBB39A8|nr:hypothetical protein [Parapedobacter sp. 10938]MEC3879759.1 hypothetical protein [Parapedobacter sp. 10938]